MHFTLKVFQGCNLSATCESFVFFFPSEMSQDITGARCAVQFNCRMQRSAGITSARRSTALLNSPDLSTVWPWPGERPDFGAGYLWRVVLGCWVQHCYGVAVPKG